MGVIATITKVLADASVSVFVMSTFDTDYFLVQAVDVDQSVKVLEKAGHSVQNH